MRISRKFNLGKTQFELDFIDVNTNRDKCLFVDPVQIARSDDAWSRTVIDTIGSFFQCLINLLNAGKEKEAFELFSHLSEPNETCLGMSQGKPDGRGVGPEDTKRIFKSLAESRAVKSGLVSDIEDCVIFVDNFGPDKLSDMTTNIIREHLLEYTREQCGLWGIPLQAHAATGKTWNRSSLRWEEGYGEALIIGGRRILLVPKSIVSSRGLYSPDAYHQKDVLEFLQNEHLGMNSALIQYRSPKGKYAGAPYVTKKSLEEDVAKFSKEFLVDFTLKHKDVFDGYRNRIKLDSTKITNQEIEPRERLADVCDTLIGSLIEIVPGGTDATKYHRLITGVLELIFYPHLVRPKVEVEIHDGRKRIDIVFNNSASDGFFSLAPDRYKIPIPLVLIECKNYSADPHNPELDQLAGRFSPQRGQLGLLFCRKIEDAQTLYQRCADHWSDRHGLILPFADADLLKVLDLLKAGNELAVEDMLHERAGDITRLS